MAKRIFTLLLSVIMVFGILPVLASEEVELGRIISDVDFEGSRLPFELNEKSEKNSIKVKGNRSGTQHYMHISRRDNIDVYAQHSYPAESPDNVVFEMDILMEVMGNTITPLCFSKYTVVAIQPSGLLTVCGVDGAKLDMYTWYTVSVACNFKDRLATLFINGKKMKENIPLNAVSDELPYPASIRINISKSTTRETAYCVDNFAMYEAKTPVTKAEREKIANSLDRRSAYYDDNVIINALEGMFAFNYKSNFVFLNGEKIKVQKPAYITEDGEVFLSAEVVSKAFNTDADKLSGITTDGKLYIPAKSYAEKLGKRVYEDGNGLVVVSDKEFIGETDETISNETRNFLTYQRPTRETLKADYEKMGTKGVHPRLLVRPDDIERIKGYIEAGDEYMTAGYRNVIGKADGYVGGKPIEYVVESSGKILNVARDLLQRVTYLGTAYMLTEDAKYAETVYENLLAAASFPDWNHHTHYLDTGELSAAFALGYDSIYNYLTEERRAPLVKAMKDYCMTPARNSHYSAGLKYNNNWNSVVNGGIALVSMMLLDEEGYEDIAFDTLEKCIRGLEYMLPEYAPHGAWEESSGYWNLAIRYMLRFVGSLKSAFGTEYSITEIEGFSTTGLFAAHVSGPTGLYNYHDSSTYTPDWDMFMWFADILDNPQYALLRFYDIKEFKKAVHPYDMYFYDPAYAQMDAGEEVLPLDAYMGRVELVALRASWADRSGMYIAAHGGYGKVDHWNLDSGTFVVDAMGERFAEDIGNGNYSWPGFINTYSYLYYLKRTEGQNCIVINPKEYVNTWDMGQDWYAFSKVIDFVSKPKGAYAVMDLTDAYNENGASHYLRGYKIEDNRNTVTVRDELTLTGDSNDVHWFMHTKANIESIDGNKVILERNGKRLLVDIAVEGATSYTIEDKIAEPLPTSPVPTVDQGTYGHKIAVIAKGTGDISITAKFIPLILSDSLPGVSTAKIADWSIPDGEKVKNPVLKNIYVDDKPIGNFEGQSYNYTVLLSPDETKLPVVTADGENVSLEVVQSKTMNGSAQIKVYANDDKSAASVYSITFKQLPVPNPVEGRERFVTYSITSDDVPQPENPPENMSDENSATRWSAEGIGVAAEFDLGEVKEIGAFGMQFYAGETRTMDFSVEISEDGMSYESVMYQTSDKQGGLVVYPLKEAKKARYVRLVGRGGTNSWFSVSEFAILGTK